jgi:glutaredoxin
MVKLTIYYLKYCGFCRQALNDLDAILEKHPEYREIPLELVDESVERERARKQDYFYVPTFYIDNRKVHEGAVKHDQVESILREAHGLMEREA